MKKVVVVSGLPGSGKSSVTEGLSRQLSLPLFSIDPIEAAMWRKVAADSSAQLIVIEVVCSDEQTHRQRIEKRVRNIPGMPEVTWERVQKRKREFEPWQGERLTLDSVEDPATLIKKAIAYIQKAN